MYLSITANTYQTEGAVLLGSPLGGAWQREKSLTANIWDLPGSEKSLASPANLPCRDSSCLPPHKLFQRMGGNDNWRQFLRNSWTSNDILGSHWSKVLMSYCLLSPLLLALRHLRVGLWTSSWKDVDRWYLGQLCHLVAIISIMSTSWDPMDDEEMLMPRCKGDIGSSEQFEHTMCTWTWPSLSSSIIHSCPSSQSSSSNSRFHGYDHEKG